MGVSVEATKPLSNDTDGSETSKTADRHNLTYPSRDHSFRAVRVRFRLQDNCLWH